MVALPEVSNELVTSRAPRSAVSPQQIASPYRMLAENLNKGAEALDRIAEPLAEQAGFKAVTTDADGKVQVDHMPFVGPAANAYARGVKMGALAEGEGAARRADIGLRQQFRDDPEGYLKAAESFKKGIVTDYTKAAGPEVGYSMARAVDSATTLTYKGLLNEKERLDLARADHAMESQLASLRDDLAAHSNQGDLTSAPFKEKLQSYETILRERTQNPRLAYPKEQAEYELQHLYGELRGNALVHHVVGEIYADKNVDPDKRAQAALDAAETIRKDPSLKLTPSERETYYHRAVSEVRSLEAVRHQDIRELRSADLEYKQSVDFGGRADPEVVNSLIQRHYELGDKAGALSLQGYWSKHDLMDNWGKQSLADMNRQFAGLNAPATVRNNNPGAQWPGPTATRFGATGSENVSGANKIATFPTPIHGAAAQFALLDTNYAGMTLAGAITKWSGGNNANEYIAAASRATGIAPGNVITSEMLRGPQGIVLAKAMAHVETGRQFPLSDEGWAQAQKVAFSGQSAPSAPSTANPATALWLQQNRANDLSDRAVVEWKQVMKDLKDSKYQIFPSQEKIKNIGDAAMLSGNSGLSDVMAHDVNFMDTVQQASRLDLPTQQALITEYERRGQAGTLDQLHADLLKGFEARKSAIETGLKNDPVGITVSNLNMNTPSPLDMNNLLPGLQERARIVQTGANVWKPGGALSALGGADLRQVTAALDTPNPMVKAGIFQAISALPEDVRNATLAKLGEKRPDLMVASSAGALMKQAPEIAMSILRGQEAIKADKGYLPTAPHEAAPFNEDLDKKLPAAAYSLAARTTDNGPFETDRGAIRARYADLSAQAADTSGKLDPKRLQQAVDDVTGGILYHQGKPLIAPMRGMSQVDFDKTLQGLNDNDLIGVTTPDGKPVTANNIRDLATLESHKSGRYLVKFGTNTYALQNDNTEMPNRFVLDLRNRQVGPWMPSLAGMTAGVAP